MSGACTACGFENPQRLLVCPQCGIKIVDAANETTASTKLESRPVVRFLTRFVVPAVVIAGIYTFYRDAFREYHPVIAKQPEFSVSSVSERTNSSPVTARVEGPFLIVSLKEVMEKRIVRFTDPEGVQDVPILAYFSSTGKLVTAMSISENCRSRDFYLEGEDIHCASCPSHWNASSLEAYACCQKYYPDPIPSTVLGDEVRIETQVVRSWQPRS